ncbi:SMP-30/gluconolactonase/LRE family protein [Sphingobium phenoxybenzoativorans]|uniref:SMP-30/gluconolactonase/LRE family protein n=1 Tax=Sphingobium phenoxybenzoativorans TaxID=1592790 RepID=UPI0008724912|nr:SMP-30/gluconolactonase/LRE family protein [Sphingobium phenoxybenzoativorans]
MYPPPQIIEAEIFTTLPASFARSESPAEWVNVNMRGRKISSFLEGPSFDRDGNLFVVDIPFGRVFKITPDREWSLVAEYDGWPNGTAIHRDGTIYIADQKNGIVTLNPATGKVEKFLAHDHLEGFRGCNDLVFATNGDLYFTDQGQTGLQDPTGRVFRHRTDGRLEKIVDFAPSPNGLGLSPDENALYLCVTRGNAIWRVPLLADGHVTKVGNYIQLSGGMGPDGMAVDQDGGIAVAHYGGGSVWVFSRIGEPLYRIQSPTKGLSFTNVAFGGPENRHLFIVDSDNAAILRAELPTPGLPLYSHQ